MPTWAEPRRKLTDGRIELRLPDTRDVAALQAYASTAGGLEGVWVPLPTGADELRCAALIDDWLAGWRNLPSVQGPALVIIEADSARLIGHVGLRDRGEDVVEIVYGVAPDSRGHGYATAAARLAALWLLDGGFARAVELRIGKANVPSQRVAKAAGFVLAGTIESQLEEAGEVYEDLRFVHHRGARFRPAPG